MVNTLAVKTDSITPEAAMQFVIQRSQLVGRERCLTLVTNSRNRIALTGKQCQRLTTYGTYRQISIAIGNTVCPQSCAAGSEAGQEDQDRGDDQQTECHRPFPDERNTVKQLHRTGEIIL